MITCTIINIIIQDEVQWWTVENYLGQQGLAPVPYLRPAQVKKNHHKKEHHHYHKHQSQQRHSKPDNFTQQKSPEKDRSAKSTLATVNGMESKAKDYRHS